MKKLGLLILIVALAGVLTPAAPAAAQGDARPVVYFFYSTSCPHCRAEQGFLDELENQYADLKVNRYAIEKRETLPLLETMVREYGAEQYFGVVPLTFVGNEFFVGFDDAADIGAKIEQSLVRQFGLREDVNVSGTSTAAVAPTSTVALPLIGDFAAGGKSFAALAVVFGLLDGVNVCSLGAIVLILGLTLALRKRRKIAAIGGTYLAVTAALYGALIVLWYRLFKILAPVASLLEFVIGAIALTGGVLLLRQFVRYRKFGPACGFSNNKLVNRVSQKVTDAFDGKKGFIALIGIVALFAAILTVVEFPCSAAVPLTFAGLLSDAGLSTGASVGYIALFVLFYLLDELIVYGIAVWRMSIWIGSSPKFAVWAALVEGVILILLGASYILGVV